MECLPNQEQLRLIETECAHVRHCRHGFRRRVRNARRAYILVELRRTWTARDLFILDGHLSQTQCARAGVHNLLHPAAIIEDNDAPVGLNYAMELRHPRLLAPRAVLNVPAAAELVADGRRRIEQLVGQERRDDRAADDLKVLGVEGEPVG